MTARERFVKTMRFEQADRVPLWEEGLREDVLARWGEQEGWGKIDHYEMFHLDRRETFQPDLQPIPKPMVGSAYAPRS